MRRLEGLVRGVGESNMEKKPRQRLFHAVTQL